MPFELLPTYRTYFVYSKKTDFLNIPSEFHDKHIFQKEIDHSPTCNRTQILQYIYRLYFQHNHLLISFTLFTFFRASTSQQ